ncbi:M23 family metallopeptidase [Sphingomonas sp. JC676]|uniref:M23 family metallopeptidase n=1 Tax=Sphingomonas sp. JC676 TaxID=2768065 RepID=UPI0016584179|nr:M23 family metallopeptidase [Sphingomonas sp. JC676]MBC9034551.1 M23 family metallopeptidase [Sphingomonas sp. JC676]
MPASDEEAHQAQVEARAPWEPNVVRGSDGRQHLAYELHITSFDSGDGPLTLEKVSVFADGGSQPLLTVQGPEINGLLAKPMDEEHVARGISIESGRRTVLFLWLTLPGDAAPRTLRHQLDFRTAGGSLQRAAGIVGRVADRTPIVLGPPLRGGLWLAAEGPGNAHSHHWGSLVAVDGMLTIPQRFAIDWFGLDENGHSVRGRHQSLAATTDGDWIGFDHEVLAVADGVVRDVRNDAPDGTPLAPLSVPDDLTVRTLYGNFVVLEVSPGVFAHYAHLRKDSVTVKVGDHVRRGAVIGRLGQSGAAGAPHLHFHVSNRMTFEESEGLPYLIDSFSLLGKSAIEQTFDPSVPVALSAPAPAGRRGDMPVDQDVVRFP